MMVGNFLCADKLNKCVAEDLASHLGKAGWTVLRVSEKKNKFLRLFDMLKKVLIYRRKYAVAHIDVYSGRAFIWAEAVCRLLRYFKKPYVITLHGGNLPSFAQQWPRSVRALLSSASAVTPPSFYMAEQMAAFRKEIIVILNPISIENYLFKLRQNPQPMLVWLRAFHKIYNPSLALQVLALLVKRIPSTHLHMTGFDKYDGSLKTVRRLCVELGIVNNVTFYGAIKKSEISDFLNRGDIFLNTATVDNSPISVLEAMACGLDVVRTNVGGIPYLLENEKDALLFLPMTFQPWPGAIQKILTDTRLAVALSQNARAKAEQHYGACVLPRWERLFTERQSGE